MSTKDLEFGYSVWKKHMDSIVGYQSNNQGKYSMIHSSSGMFLKTDYLYGYTCLLPEQVHYYVDQHPECLDIAMNMMVSGMTAAPPLLVHTNHSLPANQETSNQCIQDLTLQFFNKKNPLILNDEIVVDISQHNIE